MFCFPLLLGASVLFLSRFIAHSVLGFALTKKVVESVSIFLYTSTLRSSPIAWPVLLQSFVFVSISLRFGVLL